MASQQSRQIPQQPSTGTTTHAGQASQARPVWGVVPQLQVGMLQPHCVPGQGPQARPVGAPVTNSFFSSGVGIVRSTTQNVNQPPPHATVAAATLHTVPLSFMPGTAAPLYDLNSQASWARASGQRIVAQQQYFQPRSTGAPTVAAQQALLQSNMLSAGNAMVVQHQGDFFNNNMQAHGPAAHAQQIMQAQGPAQAQVLNLAMRGTPRSVAEPEAEPSDDGVSVVLQGSATATASSAAHNKYDFNMMAINRNQQAEQQMQSLHRPTDDKKPRRRRVPRK